MTNPINTDNGNQHRKPRVGERTRGAVDAMQTKFAVGVQNLDPHDHLAQLQSNIDELPDAAGVDAAFVALISEDGVGIETVLFAKTGFARCRPDQLAGEKLDDWPWLCHRLGHLRVVEVADTMGGPQAATDDLERLNELHLGSLLLIGFSVDGEIAGFLGIANELAVESWDANLNLLMKLFGSSLASGLERVRGKLILEELEERNALIATTANDGIWDFDGEAKHVNLSRRWKMMLGYDPDDDDVKLDWYKLVHPDDIARVQARMREHLEGKTPFFESVHRMKHQRGEWRWMQSRAKGIVDDNGRLIRLLGAETDITERKLYEDALFREKESAQITLQSIGDGVITTDSSFNVEYVNPVAEELTGWRVDDASGRPIDEIFRGFHEETCEPLENPLAVAMRRERPIKSVRPTLLIRRDGNELYIESTASPIRDGKGAVTGGVLVFHDVSESRDLNRRLSYHASHDILTGLVNRTEFENRVERALKSAKARETSYALLYLDLDQFKIVNDSCGHSAGDALLGQLGTLLKAKIRWRDTLARLGGDEFGVLLESCSLDEAMGTAETLRMAIGDYKFVWEDRAFRLGVSIGVVPISAENEDVAGLLTAADSACAAAKEAGRNRIHSFQENDIDLMRRRREMQWAARINNALEEDRFELFRQTIQPLQTEEHGAHYEILLRMRDESGGIISPGLFIEAAERYGITPKIDRWVLRSAFRWLVSEADERERLALCSINLSGQSLADEKFLPFVIDQFQMSGIDATKICFEITETAAIASYSQANRFINALKELGCKFALDDFGTGLSSFGYLKHFPVDFLKIDGSFVKEILHDPIDREMVRSINEIGHLTGKQTIAEFAENEEIITMLKGMGIDYAQGYGVSEPKRVTRAVA
ncbi:MAG: EAL domain-containing protein [Gammaproteobacteria bacterium]|nr:EAL domain-containing protein [Gammaproteobacteria bacterium]MBT8104218.1 EAL domain-containing protein [Gammaproteobacteria bacterium]NNF49057.1 EAL domain-containing protein [Woeseiaceae bacterium]NNK24233.1 EAL domain-containing protein [Woeseiaceae bacterium]